MEEVCLYILINRSYKSQPKCLFFRPSFPNPQSFSQHLAFLNYCSPRFAVRCICLFPHVCLLPPDPKLSGGNNHTCCPQRYAPFQGTRPTVQAQHTFWMSNWDYQIGKREKAFQFLIPDISQPQHLFSLPHHPVQAWVITLPVHCHPSAVTL